MYTRAKKIGGKVMARGENNVNALAAADTRICGRIIFLLPHHAPSAQVPMFPTIFCCHSLKDSAVVWMIEQKVLPLCRRLATTTQSVATIATHGARVV